MSKPRTFIVRDDIARARVMRGVQQAPLRDKAGNWLVVTIKRAQRRRSIPQNSLYWAWLTIVANETGHTADEMHEYFKRKFLPMVVVELGGDPIEVTATTTKLATVQMQEYLDRINAFCATDLELTLPASDDPAAWEAYEEAKAA